MMSSDVAYTFADVSKARSLIQYNPLVSVQEGVKDFYAWFCENHPRARHQTAASPRESS